MTDDRIASQEVLDEVLAILSAHVLPRIVATALLHDIARVLQAEVNRAELAEAERDQAVATMRGVCDRLRELSDTAVIEAWFRCPRCGARGPAAERLVHEQGCILSSRPPPRLSGVAPKTEAKQGAG